MYKKLIFALVVIGTAQAVNAAMAHPLDAVLAQKDGELRFNRDRLAYAHYQIDGIRGYLATHPGSTPDVIQHKEWLKGWNSEVMGLNFAITNLEFEICYIRQYGRLPGPQNIQNSYNPVARL